MFKGRTAASYTKRCCAKRIGYHQRLIIMVALGWGLCMTGLHAQPTEVRGELAIDEVTVYPRSAIVTRTGGVDIPAGSSTLVVDNLPQGLNAARLQLSIEDGDVRFSNVQIQESYQGQAMNPRENELRDRLQALQDERQVLVDDIETAQSALRLLDSVTGGGESTMPSPDALTSLVRAVTDNAAQARAQIREATIALRAQDRQIEQIQFELDQIATAQSVYSRLHINLQADNATTTRVSLSYPQSNASWSWMYEARLDTADRQLELFRQAAVMQATGEDWDGVTLTLSTANPFTNTVTPELAPLFVDIGPPPAPPSMAARAELEEVIVTGSAVRPSAPAFDAATTIDTRYQIDYVIPGRVNVAADRQQQVLPVDRQLISVNLVSRTVPSRDTQAYLEARFDFDGETPMQNGRLQMYRDGAFIGDSHIQEMLPGQAVRIPFGVDQRIEVQRFDEQQESRNAGIFGRNDVVEERIRYEITSHHPAQVELELLDRIPVSRHADISVSIPREATAASETNFEGESGILMWSLDLDPQDTQTVRHYYDVRHPRDAEIRFTR